jgi:hypothetical protein
MRVVIGSFDSLLLFRHVIGHMLFALFWGERFEFGLLAPQ